MIEVKQITFHQRIKDTLTIGNKMDKEQILKTIFIVHLVEIKIIKGNKIKVKMVNSKDLKIIMTQDPLKNSKMIDHIIRAIIIDSKMVNQGLFTIKTIIKTPKIIKVKMMDNKIENKDILKIKMSEQILTNMEIRIKMKDQTMIQKEDKIIILMVSKVTNKIDPILGIKTIIQIMGKIKRIINLSLLIQVS